MDSLLGRFEVAAYESIGGGFAPSALRVALALARAPRGAILLKSRGHVECLASNLDPSTQEQIQALLIANGTPEHIGVGRSLLTFGRGTEVIGVYLEDARHPQATLRLRELVFRRLCEAELSECGR